MYVNGLCPRAVNVGLPVFTKHSSPRSQVSSVPDFVLGNAARKISPRIALRLCGFHLEIRKRSFYFFKSLFHL